MANIITTVEYYDFDDSPSPADNVDQIEEAIAAATAHIEDQTGRVFEIADNPSPNDEIETLDGKGYPRLYTRNAPVTAISMLEYFDGVIWQEYDNTTYPRTFKAGSNIIYFTQGHIFPKGYQNIRATFEHGYTTAFPSDLKWVCYALAKYLVHEAEHMGIIRQADGEQTFWYGHELLKKVSEIISRYRTVW